MPTLVDEIAAQLEGFSAERLAQIRREVDSALTREEKLWKPNAGPQLDAFLCEADELFYGGQAGGGKTDLLLGLAHRAHDRSLILRRVNRDVMSMIDRMAGILETRDGYNGQERVWRHDGRMIEFGGCQGEWDKERYKGRPHDFIGFDEVSDFTESQYTFIIAWNRSVKPGQRSRVVAAGNPPTKPEGLWVLKRWGPWLDPKHPYPAKHGELRWYTTDDAGNELEVAGRGPHIVVGSSKPLYARSRTFIPAEVRDNPDLMAQGYPAQLDSLPAEIRQAYRDGNFQAELRDDHFQLIPTMWIREAMERWEPEGWKAHTVTAMAIDPAGGGPDAAELCWRHGGWYDRFVTIRGPETADAGSMMARMLYYRRGACPIIVDGAGGWGGAILDRMKGQGIPAVKFVGAESSVHTTADAARLRFINKRAEVYWRFREALDPTQEGGSEVVLPPDDELKADLCAPHWELMPSGIKIEAKESIRERIGRSPGKGDACVMCWSEGARAVKRALMRREIVHEGADKYRVHRGTYGDNRYGNNQYGYGRPYR